MCPTESSGSTATLHQELEAALRAQRAEWSSRLERIGGDRRRQNAPLDPDFAEQAVQRENDETLDLLDAQGQKEIAAIDAALGRIAAGDFGTCIGCGESIPVERLRAQPTATSCMPCAREGEARG
jgi:RNA polymerase-binding transcription factor DksA